MTTERRLSWRQLAVIGGRLHRVVRVGRGVPVRVCWVNGVVERVRIDDRRLAPRSRRQLMVVVMVMHVRVRQVSQFIAQDAGDRTDTGHVRFVADVLAEKTIADLPGEDARVLLLQLAYVIDHLWCGDPRL